MLIVDDEPAVCHFVAGLLRAEGHTTEVAVTAPLALTIVRNFGPFDLLLIDADDLPGLGVDFVSEVRRILPEIKVLYLARRGDARFTESGGAFAGDAHIDKPVSPARLLEAVSTLLAKRDI